MHRIFFVLILIFPLCNIRQLIEGINKHKTSPFVPKRYEAQLFRPSSHAQSLQSVAYVPFDDFFLLDALEDMRARGNRRTHMLKARLSPLPTPLSAAPYIPHMIMRLFTSLEILLSPTIQNSQKKHVHRSNGTHFWIWGYLT